MSQGTLDTDPGINSEGLGLYMLKRGVDVALPIKCKKFSFGQSNPTFMIIDNIGKRFVVRKKPDGELISNTAHAVEREYRIIKALGDNTDVPVPKTYLLCEDTSILGTPFYIMEFLDGRIFVNPLLLEIDPSERKNYWKELVRVLTRLHRVDFKKIGLTGYGRDSGYYSRQCKSLHKVHDGQAASADRITGVKVGPLPKFYDLIQWFSDDKNRIPDDVSIVHGDYKLDNVVFHKTEPRIIGILDWELSTIGNPRADLANMTQYLIDFSSKDYDSLVNQGESSGNSSLNNSTSPINLIPNEDEMVRLYCEYSDRDYPLPGWKYALSFSYLRNSVIGHGIAARLARGQASSLNAKQASEMAPRSIMRSFEIANSVSPVLPVIDYSKSSKF
ncbi:putative acyl-CoA dehydrogenase IBR3 [Smittium culicis]|uniref:Putative acyl-CoA dehydrogenase IBR3 n=1 Tax=Smittium culicis TaxID=133412 RepID=A0A1R1WXS2_9FUNG|nr:putative acyl-CoA dehydrogenase IBR3 [Smittium culicis]